MRSGSPVRMAAALARQIASTRAETSALDASLQSLARAIDQGYIHRGDYGANAKVYATRRVGCIWAKVSYGYPAGSLTIGSGVGGSISGGSYEGNGYYSSCRRNGKRRPRRLSLYGVGYAKALLNSSTLEICTSKSKRQGPRFCSFEKNHYGD